MSVTLGEKAVCANHFPRLMFLNKPKHILSSPTFTEAGTGMDCETHRVLVWQLQAQKMLGLTLPLPAPPPSGCEAVP